ncbi:MAG: hypothetical protein KIT73_15265 [Burkholderiales bacterium]|nr:hypothetical protein [Burkholderiales bacterium]
MPRETLETAFSRALAEKAGTREDLKAAAWSHLREPDVEGAIGGPETSPHDGSLPPNLPPDSHPAA